MNLLLGVGMLAAAALLFAWAYGKARKPVPARWTRKDSAMISITLMFATFFTIGIGFFATALLNIGPEFVELGLIGAAAVALGGGGSIWLARRLAFNHGELRPHTSPLQAPIDNTGPAKAA
ncbi:hypothetical protein [Limimaricola sp. AA108-03]|uniref:hypothetical protein n=1 Tax=Limimaricola sp. AA108-03 TaxID=3425945 RepID=UPI003D77AFA4